MTREQFLRELRSELRMLSFEEEENIIDEYVSIFAIEQEKGLSDDEIMEQLGNPKDIAKGFIEELKINNSNNNDNNTYVNNNRYRNNTSNNIALFIVMLIIDIVFVLGIYISYWAILVAFAASVIAIITSSIIFLLSFAWANILSLFVVLCFSIGSALLLSVLTALGFKFIIWATKKHISWMKTLVKGEA